MLHDSSKQYLFNTSYLNDSYISFTLNLESGQNVCSDRSIRSSTYGKKNISNFPPCGKMVIFSRPLFTIIFRPKILLFVKYSILTWQTKVEFIIYWVLMNYEILFPTLIVTKFCSNPSCPIINFWVINRWMHKLSQAKPAKALF